MKIIFHMDWVRSGKADLKSFKQSAAYELFSEYAKRIQPFAPCELAGAFDRKEAGRTTPTIWVCDRGTGSRMLSSEDLARRLAQVADNGTKCLALVIGGADGFTDQEMVGLQPDLRWCFGPLTLPHELAAVVAAEQLYRAWTILKNLPYHKGH